MSIQWFPGHMNAARKKAEESMEKVDMVIEVLDGRIPQASSNPMIERLRVFRQRPCLKILNKADLADPAQRAAAVFGYNHSDAYVAQVLALETAYAAGTSAPVTLPSVPSMCPRTWPQPCPSTWPWTSPPSRPSCRLSRDRPTRSRR